MPSAPNARRVRRLHRERVGWPTRAVPEGVGYPGDSAVAGGASAGVWRTGLIAPIVGLSGVLRRAVPSAPGVGLTRHPQTGAVQQPRFLYGKLLKIQWLAASHFKQSAAQKI